MATQKLKPPVHPERLRRSSATEGESKDPENKSFAHAASGSSLENKFSSHIAQIFSPALDHAASPIHSTAFSAS